MLSKLYINSAHQQTLVGAPHSLPHPAVEQWHQWQGAEAQQAPSGSGSLYVVYDGLLRRVPMMAGASLPGGFAVPSLAARREGWLDQGGLQGVQKRQMHMLLHVASNLNKFKIQVFLDIILIRTIISI